VLTGTSETAAALTELRRAIEVGPENPLPYNLLSFSSFQSGAISDAIDSARAGLAISPFNPELRFSLAAAEAQSDEFAAAAKQLAYVVMLRPAAAEARTSLHLALLSTLNRPEKLRDLKLTAPESSALQSELAWLLATIPDDSIRDGAAAVRIARHACELEPTNSPQSLRALAAAYGETGQFDDAIRAAEKARGVATIQGDSATAGSADELIAAFRAHQPFREQPHP
jgi:tetratricopeptide (TPR) repeat protein